MKIKLFVYIFISVVLILLWFGPSYSRYRRMKAKLEEIKADIVKLRNDNNILREKLIQLEKDSGMLEEIARKKYRMGKPGEIIYIISSQEN